MAKFWHINTNFTAGAISKSLTGRTDIARYNNSCAELTNYMVTKRGGIIPRPGTIFVSSTKDKDPRVRVIPFVFSTDSSYVIELGALYARIYKNGAQIESSPGTPFELVTPYTLAQLDRVRFAQVANTMILVHPDVPPQKLQRFSDTLWTMSAITFNLPALAELGVKPATTLSLSALTGTITATAGSATFLTGDVGREISAGTGLARITAYTSSTVVTISSVIDFNTNSFASSLWTLLDSPQSEVTPSGKDVGSTINLTASIDSWRAAGFSFSDVNRYVRIDGGVAQILTVASATVATAKVIEQLTQDDDITTAPPNVAFPGGWSIETSQWTSTLGYPQVVSLFEGRLLFGGSFSFPTTIWGSEVGNAFNFFTGILDSSPFQFALDSDRYDQITAIKPANNLLVLTYGSEFSLNGRNDGPLTATSTSVKRQSTYGCKALEPAAIGRGVIFIQRSGKKIMFYRYNADNSSFEGSDATSLNDEITLDGVARITFAQEPYQIVYAVTNGKIAALCIEPEEDVFGWSSFEGAPTFYDVCSIPTGTNDQTWCVALVNGDYVIMYFDFNSSLDAQKTLTSAGTSTWTGLTHLLSSNVDCLLDGQPIMGIYVDETGTLVTPHAGQELKVGYFYESRAVLLPVEELIGGSIQGRKGAVNEIYVKVINTQCLTINNQQIEFRKFGNNVLDQAITPVTKDLRVSEVGWDNSQNTITLKRTEPLSQYIVSVNRVVSIHE